MNAKIRTEIANKVNDFLKDKYVHIEGEHPMEEYGQNYVTKETLRQALNLTFIETCREMEKRRRKLNTK